MGRFIRTGFAVLALAMVTTACESSPDSSTPTTTTAPPVTLAVTPDNNGSNLPVSTEIGVTVTGGRVEAVTLSKAGGAAVKGALRDDGTSWVPAEPLAFSSSYTATVTAASPDGRKEKRTTTFSTMGQPGRETGTGLYLFEGQTYGVGMPVALEFDPPVADSARAAVQKRLFVATNPPQPGVWHWASGRQVWYRPRDYWKPGTSITVRSALKGVPMGGGSYGDTDRAATAHIGQKVTVEVDNATKQMSVYQDDKLARTMPVSLGKSSTPSSSGKFVMMSHDYSTIFDTTNEGPDGYRVQVNYAMRLTWGGEFIHAAPWSVGDQGVRNVSHGCVNLATENAKWLYDISHIGDPVTVKNTEVKVHNGNGWTAWNLDWADYVKGSALPVPPALANPTPTPSATKGPAVVGGPTPTPTA